VSKIIDMLSPDLYLRLKKMRYKQQVGQFKNIIKKNKKYRNIHKGERCFIIANGPSIKNLDFSLLKNEVTFTVNQMARNPQFEILNPNYHLWADRIFFEIDKTKSEDLDMLEVIKLVNKKSPNTEVFYESMAKPMIDRFDLEKNTNVNYFQVISLDSKHMERGYIDFTEPIPNYPTVVDYVILLTVYMGFSKIYLIGCDCTGIINIVQNKLKEAQNNLYAFDMTKLAANRLERYAKQRNIKDELRAQATMFEEYEALNKYCYRNGVKLINATEGGLLDCLEKVTLKDILG